MRSYNRDEIIRKLEEELKRAKERERDLEETRTAMLYMLEDLNESTSRLEHAKRDWELTFDRISDPIFMHDLEFRIIRANKAYAEVAGIPYNSFIGKPYYKIFPKMDGPPKACLRALETGREEIEEISISPTGQMFKVRYYPIYDSEGKFLHSFHIMEDITEQKKAEEQIRQERDVSANLLMMAEATARTTNIEVLMDQVVDSVRRIIGCDTCLSYLWDSESNLLRPSHSSGLPHELTVTFRTEPLNTKALRELGLHDPDSLEIKTVNIDAQTLSPLRWIKEFNALAIIPLQGRRQLLGLIIGIFRKPKGFEERDYIIMSGISSQVSIALEEARLYKESIDKTMELTHKIETIQVMHEIDRSVLSILDRKEIIETAVRMIRKVVVSCDGAAIILIDKERMSLTYEAGFGINSFMKEDSLASLDVHDIKAIETGRSDYLSDLRDVKNPQFLEKTLLNEGFLSRLCLPLTVKEEVIGILLIASKRTSAFLPEDLSTAQNISAQITVALENSRLLMDLKELFLGTVTALSEAIDAKSPWTRGHSERVTEYALRIGEAMGMNEKELEDFRIAGLLHDIGKIGTYDILLNKPERLTDDEYEMVKSHPVNAAKLLSPIKQLRHIIPWIRHHHERWDGKGYPDGLKGEKIPLHSRILAVADTFDSMTAERPYRNTPGRDRAIEELKRCSGTQFDPQVVDVFLRCLEEGKII